MLLNSADIALLETWATDPTTMMMGHLSWTSIVILLSAMIVPSTPRKMLAAALVSASMGPFGVWLAHLRGVDTPVGAEHVRDVHAQLLVRGRRRGAVAHVPEDGTAPEGGARARQLRAGGAAGRGRHGRGVARAAPAARAARGHQADPPGDAGGGTEADARDHAAPLRARGAGHGRAHLAAHDPAVRLRRHRRRHASTT